MTIITEQHMKKLRHTLGAVDHYPKSKWGFRNYFAAGKGGEQEKMMRELVEAGYMEQGGESSTLIYFHATMAGCVAAGLHKAAIKRAFAD